MNYGRLIADADSAWLNAVIQKIVRKIKTVRERSKEKIPYTTVNGVHDNKAAPGGFPLDDGINWWTNGFWAGILWMLFCETGDENYKLTAEYSEKLLDICFSDFYGLHHDAGFMFLPTAVANYKLTGSGESKKRALHAANILAGRFSRHARSSWSWNIRCMNTHTAAWR